MFLKTTKECYLAKTINDNLIVFDRSIINKEKPNKYLLKKEVYKLGKTKDITLKKRTDSSVTLIEE